MAPDVEIVIPVVSAPTYRFPALGTTAQVTVSDRAALRRAGALLHDELETIDRACSSFLAGSELNAVQRRRGQPPSASAASSSTRSRPRSARPRRPDGAVDPTVGGSLRPLGYDCDFALIGTRRRPSAASCGCGGAARAGGTVRDRPRAPHDPHPARRRARSRSDRQGLRRRSRGPAHRRRDRTRRARQPRRRHRRRGHAACRRLARARDRRPPDPTARADDRPAERRAGDVEHDGAPLARRRRRAPPHRRPAHGPLGRESGAPRASLPPRASTRTPQARQPSCSATRPRTGSRARALRHASCGLTAASSTSPAGHRPRPSDDRQRRLVPDARQRRHGAAAADRASWCSAS